MEPTFAITCRLQLISSPPGLLMGGSVWWWSAACRPPRDRLSRVGSHSAPEVPNRSPRRPNDNLTLPQATRPLCTYSFMLLLFYIISYPLYGA